MRRRIVEIDYFKGVLILLMVAFHLIYIGDSYPYLKRVVYTFHMPGFLLISGYLMKQDASWPQFLRSIGWLLVPYAVMESGYVVMSSILPVREAVEQLSLRVMLDKLLLHPLGPYWYLHTLIICTLISRLAQGMLTACGITAHRVFGHFLFALVGVWVCAQLMGLLSLANGYYYMLGVLLASSQLSPRALLCSSWWVVVPLVLLCLVPDCLDRSTPGGLLILYLVFSLMLKCYTVMSTTMLGSMLIRAGRNSLAIFLFSPLFTMGMKFCVPWFAFDPTGLLFLMVALGTAVEGSLLLARVMDAWGISPYFCGRNMLR